MIRLTTAAALLLAGPALATDYCAVQVQSYAAPAHVGKVQAYVAPAYPVVVPLFVPAYSYQYVAPPAAYAVPAEPAKAAAKDDTADLLRQLVTRMDGMASRMDQIEQRLGATSHQMPLAVQAPRFLLTQKHCVSCHGPHSKSVPLFAVDGTPTADLAKARQKVDYGSMPPPGEGRGMSVEARQKLLAEWK